MDLLAPFRPYLVGSVLAGAVTERSDIDLHLFADSHEEVEEFLRREGLPYELDVVTIRHGGEFFEYPHIYLEDEGVVVECTVYPLEDIHRIPKSSITGKPMERATAKKLRRSLPMDSNPLSKRRDEKGTLKQFCLRHLPAHCGEGGVVRDYERSCHAHCS